jgi:hypothetical protein
VGCSVGVLEGRVDGEAEVLRLGLFELIGDGIGEGLEVGGSLGPTVGFGVGENEGMSEGMEFGVEVGVELVVEVGVVLGVADTMEFGIAEGIVLVVDSGDWVGDAEGTTAGARVIVGAPEAPFVGLEGGRVLAATEGASDAFNVAVAGGTNEGSLDGTADGELVVITVKFAVADGAGGNKVGIVVVSRIGALVGASVGEIVGAVIVMISGVPVGLSVGIGDGFPVGISSSRGISTDGLIDSGAEIATVGVPAGSAKIVPFMGVSAMGLSVEIWVGRAVKVGWEDTVGVNEGCVDVVGSKDELGVDDATTTGAEEGALSIKEFATSNFLRLEDTSE